MEFFAICCFFCLLKQGQALIDLEAIKLLFLFLKVKHIPKKHWNNTTRWDIVETMHHITFTAIKDVIHVTRCIAITCDKIMTINNQSWVNIHAYLVNVLKHIPILLNMES